MKNLFHTDDEFERVYSDCLENKPPMSPEQRNKMVEVINGLHSVFSSYVAHLQKEMFRYGYECGYNAGLKEGAADE